MCKVDDSFPCFHSDRHVQSFNIWYHSSSFIILIFKDLAFSIFDFVGFELPITTKSNFFEIEPRTFPPLASAKDLASDLLIFSNPPVKNIFLLFRTPSLLESLKLEIIKFKFV